MTPTFLSPTASYFEALGVGAAVDEVTLAERFRALSRLYHPDRFATADPAIQDEALVSSALVNDAYRTLRDPFTRAEYLLRFVRGVQLATLRDTKPPHALFAQVLEIQEQLMELQEARDDGDEAAASRLIAPLDAARAEFRADYEALRAELDTLFVRYDAGQTEAALEGMQRVVAVRGYLRRLLDNLDRAVGGTNGA